MNHSVPTIQDREICKSVVQPIDLTAGTDDIAEAWAFHHAQSRLAIAMTNDRIEPDQFLDGLYDVMGAKIDPYLDEILFNLGRLAGDAE